jgi:glycosyltransferase involved in cell wall biosynthesis
MHTGIAPVAWLLGKAGMGGRYILVLHGIEAWRRLGTADRMAAGAARWIVATTRYTAAIFARENGIPTERIRVIPLALGESTAPADGDREESRPTAGLRVLAVGRLSSSDAYKGFDALIDAVGAARSGGDEVSLTVIGSGDDLPRLNRRAAACGLNGSVQFLGSVSDARLHEALRSSDVFAMPSRGEGFGIAYLEAMRYGRPCIAGNHGGAPELIEDGADGFLVEHGSIEQVTSRLLTLCRNPGLRRQMGDRARRKVETQYLFGSMRDRWFELLDAALDE